MAAGVSSDEPDNVKEDWRPVLGWEGFYEVSSLGRVRSIVREFGSALFATPYRRRYSSKYLRQRINQRHGYPLVDLTAKGRLKKTYQVHVLVCEAFHGPRPAGMDAAHNDGSRDNCRAENLRWATRAENMADCIAHGTTNRGERHGNAKLTEAAVREMRANPDRLTLDQLASKFGISFQHLCSVRARKCWKHI